MTDDLRSAIAATANSITGLTGGLHHLQSPASAVFPYAVYSDVNTDTSRDSATRFHNSVIQINIYSGKTDSTGIETIANTIYQYYDSHPEHFTCARHKVIDVTNQIPCKAISLPDKTTMVVLQFLFRLQEK